MNSARYEYRVRWRSHRNKLNGEPQGSQLRYEKRETAEAARNVVEFLQRQGEEDYCRCTSDMGECEWCSGVAIPPSEIKVFRRPVGQWAEVETP